MRANKNAAKIVAVNLNRLVMTRIIPQIGWFAARPTWPDSDITTYVISHAEGFVCDQPDHRCRPESTGAVVPANLRRISRCDYERGFAPGTAGAVDSRTRLRTRDFPHFRFKRLRSTL